ncbi:MAG: nuclear transport factor 2 family protein [Novosphingobium sp.]
MAKFTAEQAADVLAIKQVIYEWADELDVNDGLKIRESDVLAKDVRYFVGGEWREGPEAVYGFYSSRKERLEAAGGAPVMRHQIMGVRVYFDGADRARMGYQLLFFAKVGEPPIAGYCDPLATADVRMEAKREADGHWRISMFDSGQVFQRG